VTDAALHPRDATMYLKSDVYRVSAVVEGSGWTAQLPNALVAIEAGKSATVPVHVTRSSGARTGRLTVTVASESDPAKKSAVSTTLR